MDDDWATSTSHNLASQHPQNAGFQGMFVGISDPLPTSNIRRGVLLDVYDYEEAMKDLDAKDRDLRAALAADEWIDDWEDEDEGGSYHVWRDDDPDRNSRHRGSRMLEQANETVKVLRNYAWPFCHEFGLAEFAQWIACQEGMFHEAPNSAFTFLTAMRTRFKRDVDEYAAEQSRRLKEVGKKNQGSKSSHAPSAGQNSEGLFRPSNVFKHIPESSEKTDKQTILTMRERCAAGALLRFTESQDKWDKEDQ
ncbi:uncharacterized protein EHS24_008985 [Apiotrichum porosum]|uniref:Uncharacterized protein n=1 Tax=Apiotrichum porosum TaxID=105984 RepID=A0A427XNR5_9TREE|nr:uncharacterized protein EHS24_008985 [Apiotrichum porosum]RSH80408.1 hypothetical protein EHS24_008985 [Apiotrichum porosum]